MRGRAPGGVRGRPPGALPRLTVRLGGEWQPHSFGRTGGGRRGGPPAVAGRP